MDNRRFVSNILHICDYTAPYRGNFIDSLESIEKYHENIKNYYLFPRRACDNPDTLKWINELNCGDTVAYIQKERILENAWLLLHIIKTHNICRIIRHFSDIRVDVLVKSLFKGKNVTRFFHSRLAISKSPVKHFFRKLLWNKNELVGVSDSVSEELREAFPGFSVTSIVNAINFDRLDVIEPFQRSEKICLMMMGWDHGTKGVDLAIKACEKLRNKYEFVLRIVSGRNADPIREVIKSILGEMVEWIEILPPNNNVGTYYATSDIFMSPSRHEAFGYANIEAAYCENSIILTKVGGQSQLLIEGAYWVEPNNVDDLADKIEVAINELNKPERIAQRAQVKEQVQRIYSLKEWSNQVVDLIFKNRY
ncbi:MAG: glycosyltransferase family 4 protein [Oscillospiraceae bacterium]|nr:glycosyltransferase family 4 protein [Oscillospiraceae bacterium]